MQDNACVTTRQCLRNNKSMHREKTRQCIQEYKIDLTERWGRCCASPL